MASAKVVKRDPEPERGSNLLEDVKHVNLQLTPNEVMALLLVAQRVGGAPDKSLRGEIDTIAHAIMEALGVDLMNPRRSAGWRRFTARDDMINGHIHFLAGGGRF
jgi:hypothetical protein